MIYVYGKLSCGAQEYAETLRATHKWADVIKFAKIHKRRQRLVFPQQPEWFRGDIRVRAFAPGKAPVNVTARVMAELKVAKAARRSYANS
jgi:hypothetical protein